MTDNQKSENRQSQDDVPEWGAVRRALRKLQDHAANPSATSFPSEALDMMERYLDAATPSLVISAKLSQLKFSMHSLKSIANGVQEPNKLAALAIKHILGPLTTVDESVGPAPQQLPFAVTDEELVALHRFHECALDGEGYDVAPEMMRRLAELGLVNRKSGAYFETTAFGQALLDGAFVVPAALRPAPPEDPAAFDQWMHERLFANPPQPVTPFDAWQAGRLKERQAATGCDAIRSGQASAAAAVVPLQRALFDAWIAHDGELPATSRRGAYLYLWQKAIEAQPNAQAFASVDQVALYTAWFDAGPSLPAGAVEEMFAVWQAAVTAQPQR